MEAPWAAAPNLRSLSCFGDGVNDPWCSLFFSRGVFEGVFENMGVFSWFLLVRTWCFDGENVVN
jgi:hypothetical protein